MGCNASSLESTKTHALNATSDTGNGVPERSGDLNRTINNGFGITETKLFPQLSEMPMIVEENEELQNDSMKRVKERMDDTPDDGLGASTSTAAVDDAFAMIVYNQGTSNVAMVSEHISSYKGTEIRVQPVKVESQDIRGQWQ
ncbi:hypothetical protein EmuJ_001106700 [Echinococcus multilocularis]|uniref:Uncharacterized protein n=1 Tax=Echinococcus multilocularis TaxID=6211 RepID=A0A068YMK3_ECHMU|nr:hypothetical protein EmuJ_001106700 [Echinococcus multilocularis]